ncbi:MAG: hypothetical protein ACRDIV_17755 [Ktedonobacteraceae bacterium]
MSELTEVVRELEPRLLETLVQIHITSDGSRAEAKLSFSLFGPPGIGKRIGPYAISIDTNTLTEGISMHGIERYPDRMVEIEASMPMEDQLRALHASGLVGGLDVIRLDADTEAARQQHALVSWVVKTHAASQAERLAWSQSLRRKQQLSGGNS